MLRLLHQSSANNIENDHIRSQSSNSYGDEMKEIPNQQTVTYRSKLDEDPAYIPYVMVVDDEPDVLITYESFLSYTGFNMRTFVDSYQALKAFASEPKLYDLVILDIRMENLNGLQLYQSMKAMNPSSKIIFASALDAAKELTTIFPDISSQEIIKKPIDKENFLSLVKIALGI